MNIQLREPTFLMGDNHGKLVVLENLLQRNVFPNHSDIIVLGDCGLMFTQFPPAYLRIDEVLAKQDIRLFLLRGNHDNPDFFIPENNLSHVLLLPDLCKLSYKGKSGLVYPGAVSIDRSERMIENFPWFENEEVPSPDDVPNDEVDFILSHGGICPPDYVATGYAKASRWVPYDDKLVADIDAEQLKYRQVVEKTKVKYMFYGHFHISRTFPEFDASNRIARYFNILDIDEVRELRFPPL